MCVSREGGDRRLHIFTIGLRYGQSGVAAAFADQEDPAAWVGRGGWLVDDLGDDCIGVRMTTCSAVIAPR